MSCTGTSLIDRLRSQLCTGGRVSLSPLGGRVEHRGGILFINLKNGKQVKVGAFTINLNHGDLTGIVNGNPRPASRCSGSAWRTPS